MKNKLCYFIQPAGIGDCLFLQKAANHYSNLGYQVIWPILPQLMFLKEYLVTSAKFTDISLYDGASFPLKEGDICIDFQNADKRFEGSVLEAKYKMIGLDYRDWEKYFSFKRNYQKEESLFNFLNLQGKKYTLINKRFGTQPVFGEKDVYVEGDNEIVEIQFIEGFSVFDWCKVIEEADQISIVDTSLNYICEKLNLKASKMFLTSRFTPANFSHIENLFTNKWIKIHN